MEKHCEVSLKEVIEHTNCGVELKRILRQFLEDSFIADMQINSGSVFFSITNDFGAIAKFEKVRRRYYST